MPHAPCLGKQSFNSGGGITVPEREKIAEIDPVLGDTHDGVIPYMSDRLVIGVVPQVKICGGVIGAFCARVTPSLNVF